jgi:hypothetical protein
LLCDGNIHRHHPSLGYCALWGRGDPHAPSLSASVTAMTGVVLAAEEASKARDGASKATPHAS